MGIERLADIFFGMIQEEAVENTSGAWSYRGVGNTLFGRFVTNRIGNTLHVHDCEDGKCYTLTLEEKVKP